MTVNVETFCGQCFFCRHGWVNNCTDPNGGWALGCRIDGGQAEYVRVPYADQGLTQDPRCGDGPPGPLCGGHPGHRLLGGGHLRRSLRRTRCCILGAGPTGLCTLQCVLLKGPKRVIVCEQDPLRQAFVAQPLSPGADSRARRRLLDFVRAHSDHGGADAVLEVAGSPDTFRLAWQCARPNAVVTVVALYDAPQILPLPEMYGKNLTFKTGGVDGCRCAETLDLIAAGRLDTTPLITHTFPLSEIEAAYDLFEHRRDGVIKVAVTPPEN